MRARSPKFRRLGEVIPRVLRQLRLQDAVAAQPAVNCWPELAGPGIARHARAVAVERKTLIVVVDSPAWMAQLKFLKPDLLRRVSARVGKGRVHDIRFVLGRDRAGL